MFVNLSTLVHIMYRDTVKSSQHFNLLTITDKELNDYIRLVSGLKDICLSLEDMPDVIVELDKDGIYVEHNIPDLP